MADARLARALPPPAVMSPVTKPRPRFGGVFRVALFRARLRMSGRQDVCRTGAVHHGVRGVPRGYRCPGHCRVDRAWRGSGSAIASPATARPQTGV